VQRHRKDHRQLPAQGGLFLISPALEVTQYVTRLGAFDADDLICNAIGAFAGCLLAKILQNCYKKFKK